jgi:ABC-type branched-subunit amino acid transport system permease subunit
VQTTGETEAPEKTALIRTFCRSKKTARLDVQASRILLIGVLVQVILLWLPKGLLTERHVSLKVKKSTAI